MAAFAEAVRLGADGIEFDVRATRDDQLVVHHDAALRGGPRIRSLDARELPRYVPRFETVLAWLRQHPSTRADVELKEPGHEKEAVRLLSPTGLRRRCVVSSFLPDVVYATRRVAPRIKTGWILRDPTVDLAELAAACRADFVVLRRRLLTPIAAEGLRTRGLPFWVWDVHRRPDVLGAAALGADAFITDSVGSVREALASPFGPLQRARDTDRRES